MIFSIMTKGKQVKNPQTGILLPPPPLAKKIGVVKVLQIGGNASETEYSFIEVKTQEKIDATKMNNYIIEEIR